MKKGIGYTIPDTRRHTEKGELLLEILIVTTIAVAVIMLGAQIASVSLRGTRASGERAKAVSLSSETFDAVRAASTEKWQNLTNLTHGGTHYQALQSGGKWALSAGDETVTIDGVGYTRFFTVDDVSRDGTTRDIQTSYVSADNDPSTQYVTVTVTWGSGQSVTSSEYQTRWRNKACTQTAWSASGAGPSSCPSTNFGSQTNIDATSVPGSIKLTP
jgi:hypothetical protein